MKVTKSKTNFLSKILTEVSLFINLKIKSNLLVSMNIKHENIKKEKRGGFEKK